MLQRETPASAELRRWAMQCGARASSAASADERERLTRMREALLDLADNEVWLSGMARGRDAAFQSVDRDAGPFVLRDTALPEPDSDPLRCPRTAGGLWP